jgi:hypothetical protein
MLTEAERELLLLCARQHLTASESKRVSEIVQRSVDWNEVIAAAWRHGVAGLLFHNLHRSAAGEPVRPEVLHQLRQGYVRSAFRNQAHYVAIAEILERAAIIKLEVVLLKGAALARTVYHDQTLRPFADIDLLVRQSEVDKAKQVLRDLGYAIAPELLSEAFNRKYHNNLPFVRHLPNPVHIELHWRLTDRFSAATFDYPAVLNRTLPISIDSTKGLKLGREDHFLYLALHLDNHGYLNHALCESEDNLSRFVLHPLSGNRLIWFTDLHELAGAGLNWDRMLQTALTSCSGEQLGTTLRLLHALLKTPVPEPILNQLPVAKIRWPERRIADRVFGLANNESERSPIVVRFQRRFLVTRKGFELRPIRLMDLWRYIFPPRESVKFYPVHVLRALGNCARMLTELLCLRAIRYARVRAS